MRSERIVYDTAAVAAALLVGAVSIGAVWKQPAFADTGFTMVKKTAGIIMKFCTSEALTLQVCHERYEGLGWTDRITVLICASGWNDDPDMIDVIGTYENPIIAHTSSQRIAEVDFFETGLDTGIFMGVVKMTGAPGYLVHDTHHNTICTHGVSGSTENGVSAHGSSHDTGGHMGHNTGNDGAGHDTGGRTDTGGHTTSMHEAATGAEISSLDRAVLIATEPQNGGIAVSWEPNEEEIIQRSATYTWQIGEAKFSKPAYHVDEMIKFYIRNTDLWAHNAEFYTNYVRVYSDTDQAGIHVGGQFTPNMEHAIIQDGFSDRHLTEPAASSLTKYTEDGRRRVYFWWEPGGLFGDDRDYVITLMAHNGMTDVHEMDLSYMMEIYHNGDPVETHNNRHSPDEQGLEPLSFDERCSIRIAIKDIFDDASQHVIFSFQVASEAMIADVVLRHGSFVEENIPEYLKGYNHLNYYNYLEGEFYVTTTYNSNSQDELRVSDGDVTYLEYGDLTLPNPCTIADHMNVIVEALIMDSGTAYEDGANIYVETLEQ